MANNLPYELIYHILDSIDPIDRCTSRLASLSLLSNSFHSPSIHLLYSSNLFIKDHKRLLLLSRTLTENHERGRLAEGAGYFSYSKLITSLTIVKCLSTSQPYLLDQVLSVCDGLVGLSVASPQRGKDKLLEYLESSRNQLSRFEWKVTEEYGRLSGLRIDEDERPVLRIEESALTNWPALRSLSLESVYFPSAIVRLPPLTPLISVSPLTSLSLDHCDVAYNFFDLIHFPFLTSLSLNSLSGLGSTDFGRFLSIHGPTLISLTLLGTTQDTFARNPLRLDLLSFQSLTQLKYLELSSSATRLDLFVIISPLVQRLTLNLAETWDPDWLVSPLLFSRSSSDT